MKPRYKQHQTMIYFAYADRTGLVKIGITTNVKRRMWKLTFDCGYRVRLLASWPGNLSDETKLKKEFALCHVGHEWFRVEGLMAEHLRTEIWGAKIPAHDPSRKALIAIQNRRYAVAHRKWRKAYAATMQARFAPQSL